MSGECNICGEHCLDCKCELIEMNKMRIENLKRQKFYLEKFFPWTASHPDENVDEIALEKLEEVLIRLRDIKSYVKEQKERMEAIYPNETQGYLVLNYLYKNLLGFVKEEDEISYDDLPRPRF